MEQSKEDVKLGRFLSLVLRHNPSVIGISLDENGWALVEELLEGMQKTGKKLTREQLERIVKENNKKRYSFNEDHTKIRANQGHSITVDVELKKMKPPSALYHGTASRFLLSIQQQGITRQNRQYVHLSSDVETAFRVGSRHGFPVVLEIQAQKMQAEGYSFYLSENQVWLTEIVPFRYVKVIEK